MIALNLAPTCFISLHVDESNLPWMWGRSDVSSLHTLWLVCPASSPSARSAPELQAAWTHAEEAAEKHSGQRRTEGTDQHQPRCSARQEGGARCAEATNKLPSFIIYHLKRDSPGGPTWLLRRRGTAEHSDPLLKTGQSMKFATAVLWFSLALGEAAAQGEESGERVSM